jgi:hypothetical protein
LVFDPTDGDSGHNRRVTLPRWRKHPFAILGGAALLAYVVGTLTLGAFVDGDFVRAWVAPRASAALNRTVHIAEGTVGLFPRPSVRLSGIAIDNGPGSEGPTLARIDRVRMDLAWLPLFIGRVRVRSVHVDGAAVHLAIAESGRSNFGDLVPRHSVSADMTANAPLALALRRISVSNASLTYFDAPGGRSMGITGGDARIDIQPLDGEGESGWQAAVTLDADSLLARRTGPTEEILRIEGPSGELSARAGTGERTVEIDSGFLELANDTLDVWGLVAGVGEPQPSFEIELVGDDVSARTLAALLPEHLRAGLPAGAAGPLGVELRLRGGLPPNDGPSLDASIRVQGVTLRARSEPIVQTWNSTVSMEPNRTDAADPTRR